MEREYLERCLADGMSLKAIGEATGKHFATVSYWLKKHGLEPNGKAFAPKGPLPAEELQALLEREMTMLEIARHLGTGVTQVRYWVRKHGLEPARVTRRRKIRHAREEGRDEVELLCRSHGLARFKIDESGGVRCRRCTSEAVARRRRRVKEILVQEAGGKCLICGYAKHPRALEFHHLDPSEKSFGIGRGFTRSIATTRREAAKCVLLCSNCHIEVEEGLVELPLQASLPLMPPAVSALKAPRPGLEPGNRH